MSHCEQYGKDKVVFITENDFKSNPSKLKLPEISDDQNRGLILPNGEINFNCPCLGGMAFGPCGFEFRQAFTCFHQSTNETKGSECVEKFIEMQNCMQKYPNVYANENKSMDKEPDWGNQLNQSIDDNQTSLSSSS
ncbi:mitochondrial intermembrane space import and assembly protein 40-like protein [Sarcoptes scabiei]|uniref:Mitochondrial intermembrane space import and assembly protein 40-like protein n=1 Tax=Sarcoptes scabiei TaxID=52283 RepID=A0A132AI00_SARSC|nr:mitochondrial intermembrane space import and assembly protein 40-like protein [Sarcoptes scabiei]